jgi:hypothetical protein
MSQSVDKSVAEGDQTNLDETQAFRLVDVDIENSGINHSSLTPATLNDDDNSIRVFGSSDNDDTATGQREDSGHAIVAVLSWWQGHVRQQLDTSVRGMQHFI